MSSHGITFNANLSEPPRTRTDFTYKITPTVISIVDTGLGSRSMTEDIEAVLPFSGCLSVETIAFFLDPVE
jgi:hypothetical protein